MCREIEEIYYEGMKIGEERGRRRGIEIGKQEVKKEMAISMEKDGIPFEKIAKFLRVNVEEVQKWLEESLCVKAE